MILVRNRVLVLEQGRQGKRGFHKFLQARGLRRGRVFFPSRPGPCCSPLSLASGFARRRRELGAARATCGPGVGPLVLGLLIQFPRVLPLSFA